ncbi:MAG: MFS transporter [Novosphingobium sp.]|nr:MFS transporter [Novosphingobium sp.]MBP6555326.1 MFS transporter [Novosphingobium sp.]
MHPIRQNARVLTASLVGTAVEFFDFYIFGTAAALVFGPLFFPSESSAAQQLAAFMSFGLAFFARPLGAIAFGHFGDRIGRKATLVASLLLMGLSTVLIGVLPGYAAIGTAAPLLLCLLRFGQGFGLGGEWGGAALLAVENAPKGWEARFGAAPQMGAPLGFLFSNGLFLLLGLGLSEDQFLSWGWRIPFLASAVLVILGLWIRLKIAETPAFAKAEAPPVAVPIAEVFRRHPLLLLSASAGAACCFAIFYLSTAFALSYGTTTLKIDRQTFLALQLGANVFFALGIIGAAIAADRFGAGRVIAIGAVLTIATGLVFGPMLASGSLPTIFVLLSFALTVMGLTYGPLGGWLSALFPVRVRYTAISLAFTFGGIVGGALTPIAAQQLAASGQIAATGWLLAAVAVLTLAGIKLAKPAAR